VGSILEGPDLVPGEIIYYSYLGAQHGGEDIEDIEIFGQQP